MMTNKEEVLNDFIEEQINMMPDYAEKFTQNNNHNNFQHRNEFKQLTEYVDIFYEKESINRHIVLPGIRGVGKTTLLYQIYEYLFRTNTIKLRILC